MTDIKTRWVEALRSGEYKQGTHALRRMDDSFCCLGVLCDLVKDEIEDLEWELFDISTDADSQSWAIGGGHTSILPEQVMDKTGVMPEGDLHVWVTLKDGEWVQVEPPAADNYNAYVNDEGVPFGYRALSSLNDDGYTFDQIADLIEQHPEWVFYYS